VIAERVQVERIQHLAHWLTVLLEQLEAEALEQQVVLVEQFNPV
jgi:hypothetical protein